MKKILLSLLLGLPASPALAQAADVGLVNMVSADVSYTPASGIAAKVQPFMKLRDGDRVNVPAGGQVRVVFFEGSREERWTGPASFRAGKAAAEPINGKAAQITTLPVGASQRIAQVPQLVQIAKLGGIQVRGMTPAPKTGGDPQAALAEARTAYDAMRKDLPADDITPELYLYAALYENQRYDEMKPVVDEMLRKQPDSEQVKTLAAWVRGKTSR
jgi:ferric-dicitrate binding protein FerR (iron transport regulator)